MAIQPFQDFDQTKLEAFEKVADFTYPAVDFHGRHQLLNVLAHWSLKGLYSTPSKIESFESNFSNHGLAELNKLLEPMGMRINPNHKCKWIDILDGKKFVAFLRTLDPLYIAELNDDAHFSGKMENALRNTANWLRFMYFFFLQDRLKDWDSINGEKCLNELVKYWEQIDAEFSRLWARWVTSKGGLEQVVHAKRNYYLDSLLELQEAGIYDGSVNLFSSDDWLISWKVWHRYFENWKKEGLSTEELLKKVLKWLGSNEWNSVPRSTLQGLVAKTFYHFINTCGATPMDFWDLTLEEINAKIIKYTFDLDFYKSE